MSKEQSQLKEIYAGFKKEIKGAVKTAKRLKKQGVAGTAREIGRNIKRDAKLLVKEIKK